jgi:peroxiredoxin Q/BCP
VLRGIVKGGGWVLLTVTVAATQWGCMSAKRAAEFEQAAGERSQLVGRPAVDFTLENQDGEPVRLADHRGQWVVLYFYPKDGTPACSCQAFEFTETHSQFEKLSAVVYGISPDTVESHQQVTEKFDLQVPLLADPERKVMTAYGAWVEQPWGGRAIRSTVLIDPDGNIAYHWPEVIPEGHAERVREKLAELEQAAGEPTGR